MGKKGNKGSDGSRYGKSEAGAKRGFQEVKEEGSAARRAEDKRGRADDSDDDEDDVEAIRKANAAANVKRQKKAEQAANKAARVASQEAASASKDTSKTGSSSSKGNSSSGKNKAGSSKDARNEESGKGKNTSSGPQPKAQGNNGGKKKGPGQKHVNDEDGSDNEQEDSSSSSDSDDDETGLLMVPKAYEQQRKGRNEFEEDSNEGSDFDELNVVFDSFSPKEDDFHGMKLFLTELLDGEAFDSSGLVDAILAQAETIGTVVKVDGAEEVFGLMSTVSLRQHKGDTWAQQVQKFILSKCPASLKEKLETHMGSKADGNVGLIVSERMINMPQEMALPLMRTMYDEIKTAQTELVRTENMLPCTAYLRPSAKRSAYKFDHYLVFTKVLQEAQAQRGSSSKGGGASSSNKGKGKQAAKESEGELVYVKAEDEVYRSLASLSFSFSLSRPADEGMSWRGLVCLMPANKVQVLLDRVLDLVGDEAYTNQLEV